MTPIDYLNSILNRYNTIPVLLLPLTPAYQAVTPIIRRWGNSSIREVKISGSNAKGTAVAGVADLDLFISLDSSILNRYTLQELYNSLASYMRNAGYPVRQQNVSLGVNHQNIQVDLVPGVKFDGNSNDHWLYVSKSGRDRTKTNIDTHIARITRSGRIKEIRLAKIWRKVHNIDFPSVYLEETVLTALSGCGYINTDNNFLRILDYLTTSFTNASVYDPANTVNRISDELTYQEKVLISTTARSSRAQSNWGNIVW